MSQQLSECRLYEGAGDDIARQIDDSNRIILLPDAPLEQRDPDQFEHIRIMWGQRLIDDLVSGRYRSVVCAVNSVDNSHGIICKLAERLPSSQWEEKSITAHAKQFVHPNHVTIVKYDMDPVEVLAVLRPANHEHLTLDDLSAGFKLIAAMLNAKPERLPAATVCFLGAKANRVTDSNGQAPIFETVMRVMYESGFRGDVYPAPWMWETAPTGVFPRYPFPGNFKQMCDGGF
jgi:hypothetical protein